MSLSIRRAVELDVKTAFVQITEKKVWNLMTYEIKKTNMTLSKGTSEGCDGPA